MLLSLSLSIPAFAEGATSTKPDNSTSSTIQSSNYGSIVSPMTFDTGYINADGVRLRSTAGTSGKILGLLYKGTAVEVGDIRVYKDGMYWKYVIVISTGQSGYVASKYIS